MYVYMYIFLYICVACSFERQKRIQLLMLFKNITITNAFQKVLRESGLKPNKIWAQKGIEFYNRLMKSMLKDINIQLYSTYNDGKYIVVERFKGH